MASSRPKRNSQKLPDPDFVTDFIFSSPKKSDSPRKHDKPVDKPKRKSSVAGKPVSPVAEKISPSPKRRKSEIEPVKKNPTPKQNVKALKDKQEEKDFLEWESELIVQHKIAKKQQSASPKRKPCDKTGCPCQTPICFAGESDRCCGAGYTSRWCHISPGEHYCNECFEYFYRSHKAGYKLFIKWKRVWSANSQVDVGIKVYMSDQVLPYWLQCTKCGKWRQISKTADLTPEFISRYQCGMNSQGIKKEGRQACSIAEDQRVQQAQEDWWIAFLVTPPYLQKSPAAPYLKNYYPDGVGMSSFLHSRAKVQNGRMKKRKTSDYGSSSDSSSEDESEMQTFFQGMHSNGPTGGNTNIPAPLIDKYFQPFQQPLEHPVAFAYPPNYMTMEEREIFPDYINYPSMYLGIRNLIITQWLKSCKEWLQPHQCMKFVICRGLARIRLLQEVDRVVEFLTKKGHINDGVLPIPKGLTLNLPSSPMGDVVLIGAGPAGIGAALRLRRHGIKTTILEARNRIGGRVWDDSSLGVCVGTGAMIVNGCTNNPMTMLCQQLGIDMCPVLDRCDLIDESGKVTQSNIDKRIDFHFNAMLDNVAEWRKNKTHEQDVSLLEKIQDMHKQFLEESQLQFSEEEEQLLEFHISNLEYACGCELNRVSALLWDQNEQFDQWSGCHALLPEGYSSIFTKLAQGLDVRLNCEVTKVDYSGEKVKINTSSGEFVASHAVVTVPLAVLQKGHIEFKPALPGSKVKAINGLGAGIIEKVALQFTQCFWGEKAGDTDFFGHVSGSKEGRGLFSVFYDLTPKPRDTATDKKYILMTYVSGPALKLIQNKSDEEIVAMAVEVLRKMFPEVDVPDPIGSLVTGWQKDPYASMAYSYIPVGSSGDMYDILAESVGDKVYFAGEATNRQFPQTVTGAYLSGVREAEKIMAHLEDSLEREHSPKKCKEENGTGEPRGDMNTNAGKAFQDISQDISVISMQNGLCAKSVDSWQAAEIPKESESHGVEKMDVEPAVKTSLQVQEVGVPMPSMSGATSTQSRETSGSVDRASTSSPSHLLCHVNEIKKLCSVNLEIDPPVNASETVVIVGSQKGPCQKDNITSNIMDTVGTLPNLQVCDANNYKNSATSPSNLKKSQPVQLGVTQSSLPQVSFPKKGAATTSGGTMELQHVEVCDAASTLKSKNSDKLDNGSPERPVESVVLDKCDGAETVSSFQLTEEARPSHPAKYEQDKTAENGVGTVTEDDVVN